MIPLYILPLIVYGKYLGKSGVTGAHVLTSLSTDACRDSLVAAQDSAICIRHVMDKLIRKAGPGAAPESTRKISQLAPKSTPGIL